MHIIIGILTALAGLIWALNRLQNSGVDINAFNPFLWARRRKWEKTLGIKGMHQLEHPMEAAALLVVAVATCEEDLTREAKSELSELFIKEFNINKDRAYELITSSTYLLREAGNLTAEVSHILAPTKDKLNREQRSSIIKMVEFAAALDGAASEDQISIVQSVNKELITRDNVNGAWS